jgi:hypothetical protein
MTMSVVARLGGTLAPVFQFENVKVPKVVVVQF